MSVRTHVGNVSRGVDNTLEDVRHVRRGVWVDVVAAHDGGLRVGGRCGGRVCARRLSLEPVCGRT